MVKLCIPHIGKEEEELLNKVLKSGWLTHGPYNTEFEESFAKYLGVKHAISLNSCTSAIQLALEARNIRKEVIIPSFTFVATANAVVKSRATPVFAEVEYDTGNLDVTKIEEKITENTEAIMPVHYAGHPCDMDKIMDIAQRYNLHVIEDSAETIGGLFKEKQAGSFSDACFSFFPTKNITTGEGGMFTTNNSDVANKVKTLAAHGISKSTLEREKQDMNWYKDASVAGYNFRLSNLLAALGLTQLKKLDAMNRERRNIANTYTEELKDLDIDLPIEKENCKHVYQMYAIKLKNKTAQQRDKFIQLLREKDVEASAHFTPPVHLQSFYKERFKTSLPITEKLSNSVVTLPIYPYMEQNNVIKVVDSVKQSLKQI